MSDDEMTRIEQTIAEMSDSQFDALVARTRPPRLEQRLNPAERIAAALRGTQQPAPPAPDPETLKTLANQALRDYRT